jgi:hypothetical protein
VVYYAPLFIQPGFFYLGLSAIAFSIVRLSLYSRASAAMVHFAITPAFSISERISWSGARKKLLPVIHLVHLGQSKGFVETCFKGRSIFAPVIAWTSKAKGTLASPSSRTLSNGSSLLVMPIL